MAADADQRPTANRNVFAELFNHDELMNDMIYHLDVEELVVLYSMSKHFHRLVNSKITTCLERNAATYAPESAQTFPWQCYRALCMYDPLRNIAEKLDPKTGQARVRDVPSFRWLRMIYHREETVKSIILEMAEAGHRLPEGTSLVLKKLWFLIDHPDTTRRIGIIHNQDLWSNHELLLATLFFVKLDMRFIDPMDGRAKLWLRKMMMAQMSLSTLAAVLERRQMTTMYGFMRSFVEWRIKNTETGTGEMVFGLPTEYGGRLMQEGWTNRGGNSFLMPVDELVMKESIRRDLHFDRWYLDMMLWGYIDRATSKDIWPPSLETGHREQQETQRTQNQECNAQDVLIGGAAFPGYETAETSTTWAKHS